MTPEVHKWYGPPGTGKTSKEVGLAVDAYAQDQEFLYIVFSKAAQRHMIREMSRRTGESERFFTEKVRTLHSLAFEACGREPHHRGDETDLVTDAHRIGWCARNRLYYSPGKTIRPDEGAPFVINKAEGEGADFFDTYDRLRHLRLPMTGLNLDLHSRSLHGPLADYCASLIPKWEEFKAEHGIWEHTDNLVQMLNVGVRWGGNLLLVDEFQDFSPLMHECYRAIRPGFEEVHLAGDPDQAVWTWMGAVPDLFLSEPGVAEELPKSHRLPREIHRYARSIISTVRKTYPKSFQDSGRSGSVLLAEESSMARIVERSAREGKSVLVLARTNRLAEGASIKLTASGRAHDALRGHTIWTNDPRMRRRKLGKGRTASDFLLALNALVAMRSKSPIERPEIEGLLAMTPERGVWRTGARATARREKNWPIPAEMAADWFEPSVEHVEKTLKTKRWDIVDKYLAEGWRSRPSRVRVGTIHAAKGLEAQVVVLLTKSTRRIREAVRVSRDALDEERRVWYVGATRASETLYVVPSKDLEMGLGIWPT